MTSKDLSIFNSLRPFSIGFDDMFDQFESMLGNGGMVQSNYPPYNITCERKFEIDQNKIIVGFTSKGCFWDQTIFKFSSLRI